MNIWDKDMIISRVISGYTITYVANRCYKTYAPTRDVRYRAEQLADDARWELSFSNVFDKTSLKNFLMGSKIHAVDIDDAIKNVQKAIDDTKVSMYRASIKSSDLVKQNRKVLGKLTRRLEGLNSAASEYSAFTVESYCQRLKQNYIVCYSTFDEDGKVFSEDAPLSLFHALVRGLNEQQISAEQYRIIARTEPWRSYWGAGKENIFGKSVADWSEEQKTLVLFSKMYDSAYEHSECPNEKVIEDDDLFDGWMIYQKRKREKQMIENEIEANLGARHQNADEVFIVTDNVSDARRINQYNDTQGQMVKKQREATIKHKGKVTESNLPDRKLQILQQSNQQYIDTVKGKK